MPEHSKKRIKPVIEEVVEEKIEEKPDEALMQGEQTGKVEQTVEHIEPAEPIAKKESRKMNFKLVIIITLVSSLVAAFVSGGVYVYLSGLESAGKAEEMTTPTPASSPTPEPTETPAPEPVDLSNYSVQVLNGSGAVGAAGAGEDILTEAGFEVTSTGNASNYNFEKTVIQTKSGVPAEAINLAKEALEGGDYEVEIGSALAASSEYDIVVTIGQK